jgi:hypothetical protein
MFLPLNCIRLKPGYDKSIQTSEGTSSNSGASSPTSLWRRILAKKVTEDKYCTWIAEILHEHHNSCPSHSTCAAQLLAEEERPSICWLQRPSVFLLHMQEYNISFTTRVWCKKMSCKKSKNSKTIIILVTWANPGLEEDAQNKCTSEFKPWKALNSLPIFCSQNNRDWPRWWLFWGYATILITLIDGWRSCYWTIPETPTIAKWIYKIQ